MTTRPQSADEEVWGRVAYVPLAGDAIAVEMQRLGAPIMQYGTTPASKTRR